MIIRSVELTNFRNFELRKLVFPSRNIFLQGRNGSGKSNLLESIAFTSLLRSFRGSVPREMIRIGAKEFQIKLELNGKIAPEILQINETVSGKRRLFINGHPVAKSSDFIREFHTVVFAPEDKVIAAGTSGCRRRFFDILISEIEPEYLLRLSRYHRALVQRNRALKISPKTAWAFEGELSEQAPFIAARRRYYAEKVAGEVNSLLGGRNSFQIIYRTDCADTAAGHLEMFAARRDSESRRQCTLCGPQLDEFDLFLDGKLLRTYGSTGQVRLSALLLKLAQYRIVRASSGVPLAVLVDDVTGELDADNLQLFFNTISGAQQAFFTFADKPGFTLPDLTVIPFD